jgi:hypothetical protein
MCICENCGNKSLEKWSTGRFCSMKCRSSFATKGQREDINKKIGDSRRLSANPDVVLSCKSCEKEFSVKYNKRSRLYCSKQCAGRYSGLKSANSQQIRSRNEIAFFEKCKDLYSDSIANAAIFNGWDADVVIPSMKIAIMWNGKWHYEKICASQSLLQIQTRDSLKIKEIERAGYYPYVIKDMGSYDLKFVQNEFDKFVGFIEVHHRKGYGS